jgi:hypothetical protein
VHASRDYYGLEGRGGLAVATTAFQTALQLDPSHVRARSGLVRVHLEGSVGDVLLQQAEIARTRRRDAEALLSQGEALTLALMPEDALPFLDAA